MKTGLEYLDCLSKADQVRFLKNLSTNEPAIAGRDTTTIADYLLLSYHTFHMFIYQGFYWATSSEGYDYWHNISQKFDSKI